MSKLNSQPDFRHLFKSRHIGPSASEIEDMLEVLGTGSVDELINQTIPASILDRSALSPEPPVSEHEALKRLRSIAKRNRVNVSLIGQGYHGTLLPAPIQRNILENPAWYTAYTPYQPEISQGRLEALLNFQTMVCDLTGLDVANASLLDEATAAAEAMAMAQRVATSRSTKFFIDEGCHQQTIEVLKTRAEPLGWTVVVGDVSKDLADLDVFGAITQYPSTLGEVKDLRPVAETLHAQGAVACVAADPLAITLITPPGEMGADIAIGSTQRFGMPMGFGGPHAAYIATRDKYKRSLPGRLVGVSVDARGRTAYRLALQTREQHIRREKATSNICTAQVLPAVIASMYAVYHGREGLTHIARQINENTIRLAQGLKLLGWIVLTKTFFDTIVIEAGSRKGEVIERAVRAGLNFRDLGKSLIGITLDETSSEIIVEEILKAFGGDIKLGRLSDGNDLSIPFGMQRQSEFLTHPVFNEHRSETNIVRYIRRLSDRDLALDRAMIPLGSCTMKLNATSEMIPITWPELCDLHPYAPKDQVRGYEEMADDLIAKLCEITGYDGISLQPNSGAQGEFAGLLAIRAYHRSRGEERRNICLIPQSAHGTNPASAQMAGMSVVVVKCDPHGNVDIDDLKAKASVHSQELAAIMITYPSTHGVFEDQIREICDLVHSHGGQVYLDGANMNAQVGLARPGKYGADVSHLNLHKTFCIPHGGGGPGMGPIGVRKHLIPFLPSDPRVSVGKVGPVSAAGIGSACILAISWTYIVMMGSDGLREASETAILNANYIAERLDAHFPILYRGSKSRVAHECIVDVRPLQEKTGVTVEDIAKRLIDYGFHAPTMSFPVPGTLMIEPTESESKLELDRFCDAMISIREEISQIADQKVRYEESALKRAPHSVADLLDELWDRPYSREFGVMPLRHMKTDKYWAPVNRIDNVHGDRNLSCSCPPLESYFDAAE